MQTRISAFLLFNCTAHPFWCHQGYIPEMISDNFIYDPCGMLIENNITSIKFAGDSLLRHSYQGVLTWLSGNYKNGTLVPGGDECDYDKQFSDKECRNRVKKHAVVCDGKVSLDLAISIWYVPKKADFERYNRFVFGGGFHPHDNNIACRPRTNHGQNDARFVERLIVDKTCVHYHVKQKQAYFLAVHDHFDHSYCYFMKRDYEDMYTRDMVDLFDRKCNNITVMVSPRKVTKQIVNRYAHTDWYNISWDGVHFGMWGNLLKAHEIIRGLL